MDLLAIIIIIVVLIILVCVLYPYIKYYYLKQFKPQEFVSYVTEKWISPEINNFDSSLISLENNIGLLDNNTAQTMETLHQWSGPGGGRKMKDKDMYNFNCKER